MDDSGRHELNVSFRITLAVCFSEDVTSLVKFIRATRILVPWPAVVQSGCISPDMTHWWLIGCNH